MKKAVLIMLALVVFGSFAFGEIGAGMWGRTVFTLASGNDPGTGPSVPVQSWGPSWGGPGPRESMNWFFTSDKLEFHYTANLDGTTISMVNLYGTLNIVPDLAKIHIGYLNGDGFDDFRLTSPNPWNDHNNGNVGRMSGYEIIGILQPKDSGFEAAVAYRTDGVGSATIFNYPYLSNGTVSEFPDGNVLNTDVALSYAIPSMVKITAGSTVDGNGGISTPLNNGTRTRNLFARIQLLMVQNLTLWADVKYTGVFENADTKVSAVLASGYTMDALKLYFDGTFGMVAPKAGGDSAITYGAYPTVEYNLGPATLGLWLGLDGNSTANSGLTIGVEPYVYFSDFKTRISFNYTMDSDKVTSTNDYSWKIPVQLTFGF